MSRRRSERRREARSKQEARRGFGRLGIGVSVGVGLLVLGLAVALVQKSEPVFAQYADPSKPTVVLLYTEKPHRMPDGSEMY